MAFFYFSILNSNLGKLIFERISVTFTAGTGTATLSKACVNRYIFASTSSGDGTTPPVTAVTTDTTGLICTIRLGNTSFAGTLMMTLFYKAD